MRLSVKFTSGFECSNGKRIWFKSPPTTQFLVSRSNVEWFCSRSRRSISETVAYDVPQLVAVRTCWWNPWIMDLDFNNFTTLSLELNHWRFSYQACHQAESFIMAEINRNTRKMSPDLYGLQRRSACRVIRIPLCSVEHGITNIPYVFVQNLLSKGGDLPLK